MRDAGNLLTRAGLGIPSVDVDEIEVGYADPLGLIDHLRRMGEANGVARRQAPLRRDTALAAAAAYACLFSEQQGQQQQEEEEQQEQQEQEQLGGAGGDRSASPNGSPNGVPATFQVIYMTGWAPHESHPHAAARGSATVSFDQLSAELGGGAAAVAVGGAGGSRRRAGGGELMA